MPGSRPVRRKRTGTVEEKGEYESGKALEEEEQLVCLRIKEGEIVEKGLEVVSLTADWRRYLRAFSEFAFHIFMLSFLGLSDFLCSCGGVRLIIFSSGNVNPL